jgi:hypothetical protein
MKTTALAVTLGLTLLTATATRAEEPVAEPAAAMEVSTAEAPVAEATTPDNTASTEDSETVGKLKIQSIRIADRYGAIEEDRVQAMRSEVRYVPTGSTEGYNLIDSSGSQGKSQNAHQDGDMKISSWNLFSW